MLHCKQSYTGAPEMAVTNPRMHYVSVPTATLKFAQATIGSMQVRAAAAAAAAALLDGPRQRAYLAIAEHHEHAQLRCLTFPSALCNI